MTPHESSTMTYIECGGGCGKQLLNDQKLFGGSIMCDTCLREKRIRNLERCVTCNERFRSDPILSSSTGPVVWGYCSEECKQKFDRGDTNSEK